MADEITKKKPIMKATRDASPQIRARHAIVASGGKVGQHRIGMAPPAWKYFAWRGRARMAISSPAHKHSTRESVHEASRNHIAIIIKSPCMRRSYFLRRVVSSRDAFARMASLKWHRSSIYHRCLARRRGASPVVRKSF